MTGKEQADAIYQAKVSGLSDEVIMKQFSVGLREIERAVVLKTGTNLNLWSLKHTVTHLTPKDFSLELSTVWSFKNRGKWATHSGNYRGNWSPYIPRNVILRYSSPGDLVLDQFCGAGTTAVEAKLLGRRCIARDVNPAAIALTYQNLAFEMTRQDTVDNSADDSESYEPVVEAGDARNLVGVDDGSVDLICTHPPYADIVHYTDGLEGDLSFHHVDQFIEDMKQVARECFRVLRPGSICGILIGDTRKNKMVVPMGFRTIEAFLGEGFVLKDLIIKRQHNCRTTGYWYSASVKYNFLLLAQEYLPVFLKPSTSADEPRTKTRKTDYSAATVAEKPAIPDKMECKTTWVLPTEGYEANLESNLFSRYGGNGTIIRADFSAGSSRAKPLPEQCDLLYVDRPERSASPSADPDVIAKALTDLLAEQSSRITEGGHLVIRTRDLQAGGRTLSTALGVWRLPGEQFKIREVVVATNDASMGPGSVELDLEVAHEYLLVYKKS